MAQPVLPVALERGSGISLVAQLANGVRGLVSARAIEPGARVPSIRALGADLGVARAVVEQAYDQLIAEGWLIARRGAGTYVAEVGRLQVATVPAGRDAAPADETTAGRVRMDTGTPWTDPRHDAGWRRAWREVSAARIPRGYPDAAGIPELRAELAGYVSRTRGLSCRPDEVLVTSGITHGLALLLDVLDPGAVAIEDPGYRAAVATVEQSGRPVLDVAVDSEGLDVAALRSSPAAVRAVYVTPAHQHPLGITMSAGRRIALLSEATRRGALVVEDDYDSEFRYDVAPLPALAALDRDRVIHLGSASKSVHPGLRLGWLVGPAAVVAAVAARRGARHDHPPWPVQLAFLSMLRAGHVDRLVRSARRVYADRSRLVVQALSSYGDIGSPPAGMYLTLPLPGPVADSVRAQCWQRGFDIPSLEFYSRTSGRTGLVIGFGGLTDEELSRALDVLTAALDRERLAVQPTQLDDVRDDEPDPLLARAYSSP
ncbi:MAG: PLP-dependent aminotransferase family protein [Geodermatophilaceae bacterium]